MKRHLLLLLVALLPILANAYDFKIDGICYEVFNMDDKTVIVTSNAGPFGDCFYSGDIIIPQSVFYENDTYTVTGIGSAAFYNGKNITSITIPESVSNIGINAFSGCSQLASVYINDLASWCSIEFGDYGSQPFSYASHLYLKGEEITNLIIPNNVTSISAKAFSGCNELISVTIPEGVTSIGRNAFEACSGLISLSLPSSLTFIGEYAFSGCINLPTVTIPNNVANIQQYTFRNCANLSSLIIQNGVTSIAGNAFGGCGLKSIFIPESLTSISENAFGRCTELSNIDVDNRNFKYDSRHGCNAIIETATNTLILGCKNTVIPESVITIGEYAFEGCERLSSIVIPNSVSNIGSYAFSGCI